jgi:cell wall-associated NlpC family hydrolase
MEKAICLLSAVALRKEASDASEMVSQLLFGELCNIIEQQNNWYFIESEHDKYKGWINAKALGILTEIEYDSYLKTEPYIIHKSYCEASVLSKQGSLLLTMGSLIYHLDERIFSMAGNTYSFNNVPEKMPKANSRQIILDSALQFLNTPYLWGGRSIMGIDCSGLVQIVCRIAGINMLRDASQQATQGSTIEKLIDATPGDILFFDNPEGKIIHTGILLKKNQIIHASGAVRIDMIDETGIFNTDRNIYTHQLSMIKSVV